ncbi:MAG: ABC transporter substrate-binding protein [Deltaproteobacteria bacterium]|nr:ABC transporter substrate-binding protein [Deltaproteobacteria bacterium]
MIGPRLLRIIALITGLTALAAALPSFAAGPASQQSIRIGVVAPLSGPFASGGSSFLEAATLAVEQANEAGGVLGRRIELVVADSQGRVETAKSETMRLISRERVFAIVGAYLSEETIGAIEAATAARKILIVPVAATAEITDGVKRDYPRYRYVFRVSYSIPQWAAMMAEFLRQHQAKTYAFVGAGIRWNRELAGALKRSLAGHGIVPVYEAFYSPRNPAFEPVAVAATAASPDFLVLGDPGKNSISFVKRIREGGSVVPILSVGGSLGDERVASTLPLSGPLYVQAAAWKGSTDAATRYVEAFAKRFGYSPVGYSDTLPHDAVAVLLAAIRSAGRQDTDAVISALEKGAFPGVAGTYRFDASHQAAWGAGARDLHGTVIRWEKDGSRIVFPRR